MAPTSAKMVQWGGCLDAIRSQNWDAKRTHLYRHRGGPGIPGVHVWTAPENRRNQNGHGTPKAHRRRDGQGSNGAIECQLQNRENTTYFREMGRGTDATRIRLVVSHGRQYAVAAAGSAAANAQPSWAHLSRHLVFWESSGPRTPFLVCVYA